VFDARTVTEKPARQSETGKELLADDALTWNCHDLLHQLGLTGMAKVVKVYWNPRLRSTAGYASYPAWRIELNPRLREFDGQVERTLRHELAHLVAYHRAGRRRIEPHGVEWRQACVDLGIPDESARHTLPLPRREVKRRYTYACIHCGLQTQRVRKFRRHTACSACCTTHNGGRYDSRFRFVLIEPADPAR
jgi:predicted SprT family Zn-dependent metalloprotease